MICPAVELACVLYVQMCCSALSRTNRVRKFNWDRPICIGLSKSDAPVLPKLINLDVDKKKMTIAVKWEFLSKQ